MAEAHVLPWWLLPLVVVAGAVAYVAGVIRLRRRGDRWPPGRTVGALVGLGLLAAALLPTPTGVADFPAHVARHLAVAMAAPAALALGAPLTLALRALGPRARRSLLVVLRSGVADVLTRAPVVLVAETGGMYLYFLTPLYGLAQRGAWLHLAVHVHMFLAGCLLSWLLIGRDVLPNRPRTRTRLLLLFVVAGCHDLMAKLMYAHLLPRAAGPAVDIELGAQLLYYGGDVIELFLATALLLDWYHRGTRALAREERHRRYAGRGVGRAVE